MRIGGRMSVKELVVLSRREGEEADVLRQLLQTIQMCVGILMHNSDSNKVNDKTIIPPSSEDDFLVLDADDMSNKQRLALFNLYGDIRSNPPKVVSFKVTQAVVLAQLHNGPVGLQRPLLFIPLEAV
uniref:Uncharacterized protein n=1 Tax=Glossina pallidipes TaxID=7398 RepID=A0A1A9ZBR6_GLOPL